MSSTTNKQQPLISQDQNIQYPHSESEAPDFQPRCQCICRYWLPRRYCIVLLSFLGLFNVYAMRVNLSVAIEPMSCQFNWDSFTQGLILSSFFGGYLFGNIPGGWLAEKYGGKLVFGIGVLATAILTIILPLCVSGQVTNDNSLTCYCVHVDNWCFNEGNFTNKDEICTNIIQSGSSCNVHSYVWIVIILRFFMGLFESVTFPALYALLNGWTVPAERSKMIGCSFAGMYIGNVLGFPLSSFIIASDNKLYGGWPNVFYFFSVCGILWWIMWIILVSDTPFGDLYISGKEFIFLRSQLPLAIVRKYNKTQNSLDLIDHDDEFDAMHKPKHQDKVQWKAFFTHRAALVLYLAHFSYNWSFYTLLVELPTYLDQQLNFSLSSAGFVSVLPYFLQFLISSLSSVLMDALIVRKVFKRTMARKISQTICTIIPGILLVICGYVHDATIVVACLSAAAGLMGFMGPGFAATYGDVSPTLSSVLYGIGNTIGTIPGAVSPILTGWILTGKDKDREWKIVFYIAFVIFAIGTAAFWCWGTTEKVDVLNRKEAKQDINVDADMSSNMIFSKSSTLKRTAQSDKI